MADLGAVDLMGHAVEGRPIVTGRMGGDDQGALAVYIVDHVGEALMPANRLFDAEGDQVVGPGGDLLTNDDRWPIDQ